MLKVFLRRLLTFVGIILPGTFALALLLAPPARPEPLQPPRCDRNLADATANVAAIQARVTAGPETCSVTQLYFLEVVKARAMTALCKSGPERERELGRLDADVEHINGAIAARCL